MSNSAEQINKKQPKITPRLIINFLKKVQETNNCWEWTASTRGHGYGGFRVNGKMVRAHRFSYEIFIGYIPKGLTIDHLCRNRLCVNPDHLEAVTPKENVLRGISFSAINSKKTHCPKGHKLSETNLRKWDLKKGMRRCRTCHNENQNKRRRMKKNNFLNNGRGR